MASDASGKDGGGGGGLGFIIALVLVMVVGCGAGFAFATAFRSPPATVSGSSEGEAKAKSTPPHGEAGHEAQSAAKKTTNEGQLHVLPLEPVLVNLAGKDRSWIRLEGAVAFTATPDKDKAVLLAQMSEDIAGYLRGASLAQLQSATGLESLREDLSELVQLRSKNRAVRFILRSLAIE